MLIMHRTITLLPFFRNQCLGTSITLENTSFLQEFSVTKMELNY